MEENLKRSVLNVDLRRTLNVDLRRVLNVDLRRILNIDLRRTLNVSLRRTVNVDFWILFFSGTGKTFCDVLGSNMVKLLQFVNKSI